MSGALSPISRARRKPSSRPKPTTKLHEAVAAVRDLLRDGSQAIVFCQFIHTANYDLPWNPNRLEQREGRVDRFGQPKPKVRRVTIWGRDNEIDQSVLDVLVRKAERIWRDLGIAVRVLADPAQVIEAVVENVLFKRSTGKQLALGLAGQVYRAFMRNGIAAPSAKEKIAPPSTRVPKSSRRMSPPIWKSTTRYSEIPMPFVDSLPKSASASTAPSLPRSATVRSS
jgi:hypothetical protein